MGGDFVGNLSGIVLYAILPPVLLQSSKHVHNGTWHQLVLVHTGSFNIPTLSHLLKATGPTGL